MTDHKKEIIEDWQTALERSGDTIRSGAKDGGDIRNQVIARTYTVNSARKRFSVNKSAVHSAISLGFLKSFVDPEGRERISAANVEQYTENAETLFTITALERLKSEDIAIVKEVDVNDIRKLLGEAGLSKNKPAWGDVRGLWGLPETLAEFRQELRANRSKLRREKKQAAVRKRREKRRRRRERQEEKLIQLRNQLLDAFPEWRHEERNQQQIYLHVGPPNSGKTHDALEALVEAGSGWYLAPLRLLAYEIFDRLNSQGVMCNLLTGEEYIPIPGAQITASTIEMFNPNKSGECIIIDEAQMLVDKDRGWAWTRAMMESQAPEMHIIAPNSAQNLIEKMAGAAALPIDVIEHERLTPIRVAEKNWPLNELPSQTILVAFSRRMVLHLKTELEQMKRSVSVIYGNLPPEVRHKQAERFANGETEICVATDAVGMGLNLPADHVCFYEVEKFDGSNVRRLFPSEIQQIGGRAGRYGLSKAGEVGATTKQNLNLVRKLFRVPPQELSFARIAPTVEDLEMIPGNLAHKLEQWGKLQSIPDKLRNLLMTSDMAERIELAKMLTDDQVTMLGLEAAVALINAPTRRTTRIFWLDCAFAVISNYPMPMPPLPPEFIGDSRDLEDMEHAIACGDVYLWLARRREFAHHAPDEPEVRELRREWSYRIDEALLQKLDAAPRCAHCGKPLPLRYRYKLCHDCYANQYYYDDYSA